MRGSLAARLWLCAAASILSGAASPEASSPEATADPLYGTKGEPLSGAGFAPPAPAPIVDTVDELTVASFDKLVPGSRLPWLVVYVSCVLFQYSCLPPACACSVCSRTMAPVMRASACLPLPKQSLMLAVPAQDRERAATIRARAPDPSQGPSRPRPTRLARLRLARRRHHLRGAAVLRNRRG